MSVSHDQKAVCPAVGQTHSAAERISVRRAPGRGAPRRAARAARARRAATLVLVVARVARVLGEQLLLNVGRHQRVLVEVHRVGRTALGRRAERRHVLEHVGERHLRAHHLHVAALAELAHHATPAVDVADNVAHVLLGRDHLHLHHRLHELGARLAQALARGAAASNLEGHHGRIDVVVGAVHQRRLAADDGEAGEDAVAHDRLEPLGNARDVLLGHGTALDLLVEDEARVVLVLVRERRKLDHDLGELARAARLLLVRVLDGRLARDRLAVCDLRRADLALDLELAHHAVANDLQVQLAHALDGRLPGLLVA
mmetsp:Transcript_11034/g.29223  ORF Transcript_11034/g.29223 Transcript_11034/m.29223 type:complete len:314 (-) Transcript_11034:559-1500(-)